MPTTVTRYKVLLSAPGDTVAECAAAEEELLKINRTHSAETGIDFFPIDWRRDSRADSGDEPQKLLNKQIVEDADIILAIFKERFGTPTKDYGSGTEEEIELGLSMGKTVLVYFWSPPVNFTPKDPSQFEKIGEFRKSIQSGAMYQSFDTEKKLRNQVTHDFTKLLFELESNAIAPKPQLSISGIGLGDYILQDNALLVFPLMGRLLNASAYDRRVREAFDEAVSISIPLPEPPASQPVEDGNGSASLLSPELVKSLQAIAMQGSAYKSMSPRSKPVNYTTEQQATVTAALAAIGIDVPSDLFYVGGLEKSDPYMSRSFGSQEPVLHGKSSEKEKYEKLNELLEACRLFNDYHAFIEGNIGVAALSLCLANTGGSPARHVNVDIELPASYIVKPKDLSLPSDYLVGHGFVTQENCESILEHLFGLPETASYKSYDDALVRTESGVRMPPMINTFSGSPLGGPRYLDASDFADLLDYTLGDYRLVPKSDGETMLVRLTFDFVQQCTSYAFPARILVRGKELAELSYKITADEVPNAIEGKVTVSLLPDES